MWRGVAGCGGGVGGEGVHLGAMGEEAAPLDLGWPWGFVDQWEVGYFFSEPASILRPLAS